MLEADGLIWRHVGRGTFIGARPVHNLADVAFLGQLANPAQVLDARVAIEPELARLAALHAVRADIEAIRACCDRRARAAADWRSYEAWDNNLHHAVAKATHNKLLIFLFDTLNVVRRSIVWGQPRTSRGAAAGPPELRRARRDRRRDRGARPGRGRGADARPPALGARPGAADAEVTRPRRRGRQVADAVDMRLHHVAAHHGADPGGRPGHDDVAGRELEVLRQVGDHLGDLPDHLVEVALLADLAVDLEHDPPGRGMADLRGRPQRADRRRAFERLADLPGPAHLLGDALQVAPGHVEPDAHSPRRSRAPRSTGMFMPPLPSATTSSTSWCTSLGVRRVGEARR